MLAKSCVLWPSAWHNNIEMQVKNVRPVNGLFGGEPQVVWLRWKCTCTPTAVNKHDYPTEYRVKDKRGEWHVQCDCIMLVTVRKAEEWTQAELEVATSYVDLFRIGSSLESKRSDNPPSLLLTNARREIRGTQWTMTRSYSPRRTTRTTMVVEASEAAAAEGGSTRRGSSGGRNS